MRYGLQISGPCGADRCGFLAVVAWTGAYFHLMLVHFVGSCAILCAVWFGMLSSLQVITLEMAILALQSSLNSGKH